MTERKQPDAELIEDEPLVVILDPATTYRGPYGENGEELRPNLCPIDHDHEHPG
jgi:hypothetical protein